MSELPPTIPARSAIPPGKVTIVLTCGGIGAPLVVRVRRVLKAASRSYGLKCIRCDLPREENGGAK